MTKQEWRKQNLSLRKTLQHREEWDRKVQAILTAQPFFQNAKTVMTYISYGSEPSTLSLVQCMLTQGKTVCAPVCEKNSTMEAHAFQSFDELVPSSFHILEPKNGALILPKNLDLVLVPGCGFNLRGHRLGYGGGFYDRYLKRTNAVTCGLFYECLKTDFTEEKTDAPLQFAVTERAVYSF